MTEHKQKQLCKTRWAIADQLFGSLDADDFRDDMHRQAFQPHEANYRFLEEPSVRPCLADPLPKCAVHKRN